MGKIWRFMGSLQLAVFVILSIATLAAVGTFVESSYNAEVAQKWIYYSVWMKGIIFFMAVNLIVSAIHRLPWRRRHTGFVTAHVGILMVMLGSILTGKYGVDGSVYLGLSETSRNVSVNEYELILYVGEDFQFYPMFRKEVDFLTRDPLKHPVEFGYQGDVFKVTDYIPFAFPKTEVIPVAGAPPSAVQELPALRFQLFNDKVNVTEWIQPRSEKLPGVMSLGPATIIFTKGEYKPSGGNEIIFRPFGLDGVSYEILSRDNKRKPKKGSLKIGSLVDTAWMGLQVRILNYYPNAKISTEYVRLERPTPLSSQAIEVEFGGKKHWVGLNGILKLFTDQKSYVLKFGNKQLDLGFDITLKHFEVGRYQGTMRAASYKSLVEVTDLGEREISMNEPLKHAGYTFYQASFQEDPNTGKPIASILSVNYDPGRFLKYLGCLLIVLGALLMFYLGGYFAKTPRAEKSAS